MIIRSFFRNRIVKIYIIIMTIVISVLFILSSFVNYYQKLQDELFANRNIIIVTSKEDIYKKISKIKKVSSVEKKAVLLPDKSSNVIVNSQYTLTDTSGNVLDSFISDEEDYKYKITWEKLLVSDFDYILVSSNNEDKKLSDSEIIIGLPSSWKDYFSEHPEFYLNKIASFKTDNDNKLEFKIVDLYDSRFPQLIVNSNVYDELLKHQTFNTYIMSVTSYSESYEIVNAIESFDDHSNYFSTTFECSYDGFESNTINNIDDLIGVLKLVSYIVLFIFIVLIVVVIRNILSDLNKNVQLEKKIGFNKIQIKNNIILRLISLLIGAACIAVIISLLTIFVINSVFNLNIIMFNYHFFIKVYLLICIITILLVIIKKY